MIYFDNAATSWPKPPAVTEALSGALAGLGNPGRGAHDFALAADRTLAEVRARLARLFGLRRPERVIFTKNVTEALNLAVGGLTGHIVTSAAEHNSVLRPVFRRGCFTAVDVDGHGRFSTADIEAALRPETRAVVLSHASNVTGNLAPAAEIGRLCRAENLVFILDTAQSAGLMDLDMEALGVDALCFTGHKALYGPMGTGGLALSERFHPPPLLAGGGAAPLAPDQPDNLPEGLEAGTLNVPGLAGLGAGLAYVEARTPAALLAEADRLARRFHRRLQGARGLTFYGDYEAEDRAPIVTLNVGRFDSEETAGLLADKYGLAVRGGLHCAPLMHRSFRTERRGAVRFSFSPFNTEEETDQAAAAVLELSRTA
ncbi:MAG: aminotransferase class V-fold PLP-dependent enzyme [Promicromonosporaceae bacterium]|nr:aminotransferase class V-fold PLP-dependent enzyme [Promicromonosporaceae bacterium]